MQRSELLNDAERTLWDAFPGGMTVDLGPGDPATEDFDPDTWPEEREIRAEVVAHLLLEPPPGTGHTGRVALSGARIVGELNLSGGRSEHQLVLTRCWLDKPPDFTGASTGRIAFHRTRLPGLVGKDWRVGGSLSFDESQCSGMINLYGAHISGHLRFEGANLANWDSEALYADGLTIGQDMFCCCGFTAIGEIRLVGARVGGQLSFTGACLTNPGGSALTAAGLTVGQDMFCCDGFTANGKIGLAGAHIGGKLDFTWSSLTSPGLALAAAGLTVNRELSFVKCATRGQVHLAGATIGGETRLHLVRARPAHRHGAGSGGGRMSTCTAAVPDRRSDRPESGPPGHP